MIDRFGKEVDFSELYMEETLSTESNKKRVNDKGEDVPETCDKCGSHIGVYLQGEPVYLCSNKDCKKYFGTVPCNIQESYMTYEWLMKQNYPDPDSTSGTSDFDDSDNEPDDCYCEYKSSLKDVELSKIEYLYFWSPIRFEPDDDTSDIRIGHENPRIFVTDKIGLCPYYTIYDLEMFQDIVKKYEADIVPILPRDLDTLSDEADVIIKLISSEAKSKSGEFNLYVYEVDKNSVSVIKHDKMYKSDNLFLIPKQNGPIRISAKPVKKSHVKYTIAVEYPRSVRESFEEMFDPVIQEAFDAITGEEIPINHAYTMEEMAKRSLSLDEAKAMEKDGLIPIKPPKTDEVYFGSPTNHMPEIDLNRPLFVSPYKGIASIFIWGDMGLQNRIPRGSYNHNYEEWINFDEKKMKNPLKEVHVYVEGAPFLEPFTVEQEGYIHCINTKDYLNNFFRRPWMTKDLEYLIAKTDNMKVEFTRSIKCKVKYYIKGRPSPKGKSYGPSKSGVLQYIHKIAKSIHAKYKADQKEPTGNQNCLLCAWCAEASIRGGEYLPRPVYSPRDPALEIVPGDIVGGVTKKNPGNFHDMLAHLRKDSIGQPFARWYCHVKWGHSNGGHEFLIVKIDEDAFNIMDPQQGIVGPLTADDSYTKDVDWGGTYICRIDDKPFKYMKLDQINDPKKTLPWDPKKDIPYMVKHGMCTKEEAEKELKRLETNMFTSELKKALGQNHIQESATEKNPMKLIPKDLRDWLIKGDYSMLERDDSFYYVEGHPVEEFFDEPEFCKGYYYPDKEDDPVLNCIVFSNENGDGLVYDTKDGWYYFVYHDWGDEDTGFMGRKRLSSKSWTEIIDPNHARRVLENEKRLHKIQEEFNKLVQSPIYHAIYSNAENNSLGKGFFQSDCAVIDKAWQRLGSEWAYNVIAFADRYECKQLKTAIEHFKNETMPNFVPEYGINKKYNVEVFKSGAIRLISGFISTEKQLGIPIHDVHKKFVKRIGETVQESVMGDLINGVNPWSMKRVFHISPEGHLDGQIFKPRVPEYLDEYDPSKTEFEDVETPRVCFSPSIEGCLNAILVNIGRWKTANKLRDWYVYIPEKPLKEYKYRTNKQLIDEKKVYDANLTKEIWIEEPVRLKQYGIIRIDSVTDANRKKAVPTTLGESKKRNVYNFKWHWLVKPKVLKDVPYDYSPNEVCKDMVSDLSRFKYGLGYNGSIHHGSSKDFDEKYRFESPEEFEKNGGGICFDYVEFEEGYLEAYGYTCRKFYISTETKDEVTHTFILVDDGKGEYIYPEASFQIMQGVHKVKYPEEAVRMIIERFFKMCDDETIKYYVWEYSGHPPYGSTMKECTEYFTEGEPFMEGSMNKPEKIKRKD